MTQQRFSRIDTNVKMVINQACFSLAIVSTGKNKHLFPLFTVNQVTVASSIANVAGSHYAITLLCLDERYCLSVCPVSSKSGSFTERQQHEGSVEE
jgi:hypothetical protein